MKEGFAETRLAKSPDPRKKTPCSVLAATASGNFTTCQALSA
jgi:hypothetical protein